MKNRRGCVPQAEQRYDDSALNPKTVPKTNPYPSLPSARDLYTQFPEQSKPLKRFGSDIFRPDIVGMSEFPMDLPAGADYVLGPGDTVTINIWGGVSQRISRPVDREGRISLPDAGPVVVSGLTLAQAQKIVQAALVPQYHDARVDLSVTRLHTVRVYVVGRCTASRRLRHQLALHSAQCVVCCWRTDLDWLFARGEALSRGPTW